MSGSLWPPLPTPSSLASGNHQYTLASSGGDSFRFHTEARSCGTGLPVLDFCYHNNSSTHVAVTHNVSFFSFWLVEYYSAVYMHPTFLFYQPLIDSDLCIFLYYCEQCCTGVQVSLALDFILLEVYLAWCLAVALISVWGSSILLSAIGEPICISRSCKRLFFSSPHSYQHFLF